jgi:hypothetical protein
LASSAPLDLGNNDEFDWISMHRQDVAGDPASQLFYNLACAVAPVAHESAVVAAVVKRARDLTAAMDAMDKRKKAH